MASPGPTAVIRSPVISTTGFSTMRPDCTSSIALAFTARWIGGGAAPLTSVANTAARRKRIDVLAIANVWGQRRGNASTYLIDRTTREFESSRLTRALSGRGGLLELRHVLLRDHRRRQHDLVGHWLALEDLLRDLDGLLAARRIDERRGELPVGDHLDAAVEAGQGVDADELHLSLAALRLRGEVRAGRHRVVVRVDEVDVRVRRERGLHLRHRLLAEPVRDGVVDDVEVGKRGDRLAEAVAPVARGRRAGQALDLDDVALAVERLRDVLAGRLADELVVRADEGRVRVALDRAVEDDHRSLRLEDALD